MRKNRNGEQGTTIAEFAVIALFFFIIIFAIIEFGRLLYTHNALTDATRRGARYAVLHKQVDLNCVKNVVVYGETHVDPATCSPTGPPLINRLTTTNVFVSYAGTSSTAYGTNLGTATVEVRNYTFILNIPVVRQTLNMPNYVTTLTAESAGEIPDPITTSP